MSVPVLQFSGVSLTRNGSRLLSGIDWTVNVGESWVVLGPNGCGKTSLARIAALYEHPSSGTITVLGSRLGGTDVRELRQRVALVSAAMADQVRPDLDALDVVVTAVHAALEPWWHTYTDADVERARAELEFQHVGHAAGRRFATLSSGERQRVLLARALMAAPDVVLLDEPAAGLDLGGREELVERLDAVAARGGPTLVLITHHVEEIPATATHVLALRSGQVLRSGPIDTTLDAGLIASLFDVEVELTHRAGRWGVVPLNR
ncbi:MAG: ABC transporter ATP-binding protein [Actinomycetota bacterium]